MPGETPINKIPYALDADAPDYPTQGKATAELLDTLKWGSRNLKPTVGVKQAEKDLTLTGSYQDITMVGGNLEITPVVASVLLVIPTFDFNVAGVGAHGNGTVRLDAADQARTAEWGNGGGTDSWQSKTVSQNYALSLEPGAHTIKMRAKGSGGSLIAANTSFLYLLLAS